MIGRDYRPARELLPEGELTVLRGAFETALLLLLNRAGGEIAVTNEDLDQARASLRLAVDIDEGRLVLRAVPRSGSDR